MNRIIPRNIPTSVRIAYNLLPAHLVPQRGSLAPVKPISKMERRIAMNEVQRALMAWYYDNGNFIDLR
jgi:hypothetical protein